MTTDERLQTLKSKVKSISNDDARYAVAAEIRDLGYIDVHDFIHARPAAAHVAIVERVLGMH
ncbi:hypothetical protein [Sphingobium sp.]|uniref:hypothetical protein n=1 Tax=Sphingobium sp. TaxID=1912891 RepID=UPI00261C5537|nr:hypothetical protein [Sphingobium sp.]